MSDVLEDDEGFAYGDWVEFKLNTKVFGIVVGFDCAGLKFDVQLSPSGAIGQFHGVTLRSLERPPVVPGAREPIQEDNVIDFTRAVGELRTAKTRGAA